MPAFVNLLAVILSCTILAIVVDVPRMLGLTVYFEQYLAGLLALALLFGALGTAELEGRLWRWSPREISSLLTLLAYLGLIRLWDARVLGPRTLPVAVAACFAFVASPCAGSI